MDGINLIEDIYKWISSYDYVYYWVWAICSAGRLSVFTSNWVFEVNFRVPVNSLIGPNKESAFVHDTGCVTVFGYLLLVT